MKKVFEMIVLFLCSAYMEGIDVTGIDRLLLFMNLYNSARTQGRSHLSFTKEKMIDIRDARKYIGKYIKTLDKKVLEIRVPSELQESKLFADKYNDANGRDLAEKVVENIRKITQSMEETIMKDDKHGVDDSKSCCSCKCCAKCSCRLCRRLLKCCGCLNSICRCLSWLCCCKCCELSCSNSLKVKKLKGDEKSKEKSSKKKDEGKKNSKSASDADNKGNKGSSKNPLKNIKDAATSMGTSAASTGVGTGVGAAAGAGFGAGAGTGAAGFGAGCLAGTATGCLGGLLASSVTYGGFLAAGAAAGSTNAIAASCGTGLIGFSAVGLRTCLCPCCSVSQCLCNTFTSCASGCCSCITLLANICTSFLSCFSCICNASNLCCTCLCKSCNRCCFSPKKVVVVKKTVVENAVVRE